ncbi:hypothetical protein TU70_15685 [Bacillus mycoides]|nr:hypothetical protein TU70_15685 [Bacillus mycoides]
MRVYFYTSTRTNYGLGYPVSLYSSIKRMFYYEKIVIHLPPICWCHAPTYKLKRERNHLNLVKMITCCKYTHQINKTNKIKKRIPYHICELYPESWTLKKGPMIRGFCVFLSKNLVIMEPTIEMRYGEWVKLFLTKFK